MRYTSSSCRRPSCTQTTSSDLQAKQLGLVDGIYCYNELRSTIKDIQLEVLQVLFAGDLTLEWSKWPFLKSFLLIFIIELWLASCSSREQGSTLFIQYTSKTRLDSARTT